MTRREFSITLAGLGALPDFSAGHAARVVILKAIAGAHLPATLAITTDSPEKLQEGLWELRIYRRATQALETHFASAFPRAGIRPVREGTDGQNLTYLIPFESLTARNRAWTLLNADPAWIRPQHQFHSYCFGLYRCDFDGAASGS